mmetsp:Transcript_25175/g.28999  ORF Transcript_25175/g.28999 Transcript_25175/m.28999 type:complete len:101 (-) Transcript_25175:669-971(-)
MLDEDIPESEKLAALGVIDLEEAKVPMQDDQAPEVITKTTKHTLQHEAIIEMMENYGLVLSKDVRYLEYGAGRGLLSHYLHSRINALTDAQSEDQSNTIA